MADEFAKLVDFFSIGTNDLVQYILAVDRDSTLVSDLYKKFHPSVLKAIKIAVESSKRNKIRLSVCGEMAGDPLASLLLIGMGIEEMSVETTSFLRIKKLITLMSFEDAKRITDKALQFNNEFEIRDYLEKEYNKLIKKIGD
jgi:phosphotransferase system enzyme I (PtsI)